MYPSVEARNADIEQGAGRPAAELVADVRGSRRAPRGRLRPLPRLRRPAARPAGALRRPAARRRCPTSPRYSCPSARIRELEIHHVDLGLPSYTPLDWPDEFVERTLLAIHSASGPVDVLGHPAEVLAWRLGRGTGPTVRLRDGSLPGEPPPWM